ncbi:hypothetical protein F8B43_3622 [Methylorubrum populi]|uniref:Uncharacterized protein n=1 Tax=Methylorubrum populi TaxID=223967 RepID=A0A833J420_9HYPH|nr:hypothetical protein F8B43_3622 [Methylorubrum populi]
MAAPLREPAARGATTARSLGCNVKAFSRVKRRLSREFMTRSAPSSLSAT